MILLSLKYIRKSLTDGPHNLIFVPRYLSTDAPDT
jgi:hypothetical protein